MSGRRWVIAVVASSSLAVLGCEKKPDPGKDMKAAASWTAPSPMPSQPGSATGGPSGAANPHGGAGAADPHAGMNMGGAGDPHAGMNMGGAGGSDPHGGMNMGGGDPHGGMNMGGGDPHGGGDPAMAMMQPPDPNRPIDKNKFLRGTISATAETQASIKPGAILFLAVRPIDETTGEVLGSPIAVERIDVAKLPVKFNLTQANAMSAGTDFSGTVRIDARIDGDGEARSKEPGDVVGSVRAKIPGKGLKLSLDTLLR